MNSFVSISKSQTTNLAVVAPGIAEALLATAFGLAAAIPAVIFYNQLTRIIRGYLDLVARASGTKILVSSSIRSPGSSKNWNGNTPSNVAPLIFNAGAAYRFDHWHWPVEFGGSVRHVGNRFVFEDDATTMNGCTTADVDAFVDIPGVDFGRPEINNMRLSFRGAQSDQPHLRRFFRPGLSGPGLPRRTAHL
jgi:hypothetical protein